MPDHSPTHAVELMYVGDLPCIHCGYNLRTMPLSGKCPECAGLCGDSQRSMHGARAEELGVMRGGLAIMALAAAVLPLGVWILAILAAYAQQPGGEEAIAFLCGLVVAVAGPFLAVIGARMLCAPFTLPRGVERMEARLRGSIAARRLALYYAACSTVAFVMIVATANSGGGIEETMFALSATAVALTGVTWTGRNLFLCMAMSDLARRGNSRLLAGTLTAMMVISGAMMACVACGGLLALSFAIFGDWVSNLLERSFQRQSAQQRMFFIGLQTVVGVCYAGFLGWLIAWPVVLAVVMRCVRRAQKCAELHQGVVVGPRPASDA